MKTLKPKSNWIKFNTHKAQILLSHHHSSNPTVKTNTQKKSQISNQPNKKLQKQFTTPKLSTKIAFIQENPSQLFPPDPQLRDRNEFKFPLLLSLSQRVWEFWVLFFFVFANVWELEFRFSLFLWDFKFPGMRGICRERERERKRIWSVLVETALDLLRLISP